MKPQSNGNNNLATDLTVVPTLTPHPSCKALLTAHPVNASHVPGMSVSYSLEGPRKEIRPMEDEGASPSHSQKQFYQNGLTPQLSICFHSPETHNRCQDVRLSSRHFWGCAEETQQGREDLLQRDTAIFCGHL